MSVGDIRLKKSGRGLFRDCDSVAVIISGVLTAAGSIISRASGGEPYTVLFTFGIRDIMPPPWLMGTLWLIIHFFLGAVLGAVLTCRTSERVPALRGSVVFVNCIWLGFMWYPCFFLLRAPFPAMLVILAVLICSVITTIEWRHLPKYIPIITGLYSLWLLYMLILGITALILI